MDFIKKSGMEVEGGDYALVYGGRLGQQDDLDTIYEKFNLNHPKGYTGHSLSVSDIVVLNRGGNVSAHFVDSFGFTELPDFVSQREQMIRKEAAQYFEEEVYPPLYTHTLPYAMEHGRADDYLESRKRNMDCKKAIEDAIRKNFDGMYLSHDAAREVLKEYGAERVVFILANTVQHLEYDGRFSVGNRAWAKGYEIPENVSRGMDLNADGSEAERAYRYFPEFDTAVDAYHRIPNHMDKSLGMESSEQPPSRMSLIQCRNGIETLTDIEKYSLSGKWVREETMEASQKAKEYLENCDVEIACKCIWHG